MSLTIEVTLESLKANHFDARFVQTAPEAKKMILEMIPSTASVGVGDSTTLRQIGVLEELTQRGTEVINPWTRELTQGRADNPDIRDILLEMATKALSTDVFLASSNALTEDGKIVSIDRGGNRVAGMIFGHRKVILPVGRNKIVKNVDEAIYHIKNVIAPVHAKRKEQKTPCAVAGKCTDCDSPDRICNITVIMEKKAPNADVSIILINEDLGLGWNPAWDEERISKIMSNYYQNTWVFLYPKATKKDNAG